VAELLSDKTVKILVAVADVDALVRKNSAIDEHAQQNTTSVYTVGKTFPMLPEKLSTDLTSLNYQEDRPAMVVEMVIDDVGKMHGSDIYRALVHNRAKLAYNSVGGWLEGKGPMPEAVAVVPRLAENLRIQDRVAQQLKALRHEHGALDLQTLEARPFFAGEELQDLRVDERNRAKEIIEEKLQSSSLVSSLKHRASGPGSCLTQSNRH
jgi:VacB/RNase II family 3'-5' exoribonuclease